MCAREPVERGPLDARARPRGGAPRLQVGRLHPHAGRARDADREPVLRLEVRVRAGAVHERQEDLPRAWEGARRLVEHQRDDLPAWQSARLRALGCGSGHEHVGLCTLPPVLQADGDLPRRCRRVQGWGRASRPRARTGDEPAVHRVSRGSPTGRLPAHRGRQRLSAGGLRGVRPEHPSRSPAQRCPRLSASGAAPAESGGALPRIREQGGVRRSRVRSGSRWRGASARSGSRRAR